jgi:hypothetical protein
MFRILQANIMGFPSWVTVSNGEVDGLCFGALCCAVVMTLLTAITQAVT